jgi:hypothetical protein
VALTVTFDPKQTLAGLDAYLNECQS